MRHFPTYRLHTIKDLSPGDLFLVELGGGVTTIALAIEPAQAGDAPAYIPLCPPYAGAAGKQPQVFDGSVIGHKAVIPLPDAQFLLPEAPSSIDLAAGSSAPLGALLLIGDRVGLPARVQAYETWIFDVADGSVLNQANRQAAFQKWRIGSLDENGKVQTLCSMPDASETSFG